jgi:hypothetical protein
MPPPGEVDIWLRHGLAARVEPLCHAHVHPVTRWWLGAAWCTYRGRAGVARGVPVGGGPELPMVEVVEKTSGGAT